jgi:hypothetical protein
MKECKWERIDPGAKGSANDLGSRAGITNYPYQQAAALEEALIPS